MRCTFHPPTIACLLLAFAPAANAEVFTVDTEADIIAAEGRLSLREAVALANANGVDDVIVFAAGVNTIALTSVLTANDAGTTLRIEGAVTLDGLSVTQILAFVDNDFELDGVAFENGIVTGDGGAINADTNSSALVLTNCSFTNCSATGDGGGAFLDSAINGRFANLTFVDCSANGSGGGLSCGDFDDSDHLTFTNCHADVNGGGVNIDDDGEDFLSSTFTDCTAGGDGGAVNSENDLDNFFDCTFTRCTAGGNGGAIQSDDDVDNVFTSTFEDCSAGGDGGAIHAEANYGEMNLTVFRNCSAGGDGGAIYVVEDSEVWTNVLFTGCKAGGDGGALLLGDGAALISNAVFRSCEAGDSGGAIFYPTFSTNVEPVISSSVFESCRASADGGAIASDDVTLQVLACTLTNNESGFNGVSGENGGAIYMATTSGLTVAGSTFSENRTFSFGGAIFSDGVLTVTDTTFERNRTNEDSGGALFYGANSTATVDRTTFSGNDSARDGGGSYASDGATGAFTNCTWSGNQADGDGGGHYADNPTADQFIDCTFALNEAENGGGIYATDSNGVASLVTLNNTIAGDNAATTAGPDLFDVAASGGAFVDGGFNLIEDGSGQAIFVDGVNNNVVGSDPDLAALADNGGVVETHALNSTSPARSVGDTGNGVSEDARAFSGNIDIGAYEFSGVGR